MKKQNTKEYGLWFSESEHSYTFSTLKEIDKSILKPDAQLIWRVKAGSDDEACRKRNDYLGWGKYVPLKDETD